MPTPFTIRVTKEIIARAKNCGQDEERSIGDDCAIALALKDLFPAVFVSGEHIHPLGLEHESAIDLRIPLPRMAQIFIQVFDLLVNRTAKRLDLPELEFEISVTDEIIDQIDIGGVTGPVTLVN